MVVITSANEKKWGKAIDLLPRGPAIETAERVLDHHDASSSVASSSTSRIDHLQNTKNNLISTIKSKSKGKSEVKKSWPFMKSIPKFDGSAQVNARKQHSILDEDSRNPMISDIHSRVCSIEKSLEHLRKLRSDF